MSPRYTHLLVPTDFGEAAKAALEHAIAIAEKFGSKVTLLHTFAVPTMEYGDVVQWPMVDLERQAQRALDEALAELRVRFPAAEGQVVFGEAFRQILDFAEAQKVDLVVMGTHGRKGLTRFLLGSVAEKVLRSSTVPVLIVSALQ